MAEEGHDAELQSILEVEGDVRKNADKLGKCVGELWQMFGHHPDNASYFTTSFISDFPIGQNDVSINQLNADRMGIAAMRDEAKSRKVVGLQIGVELEQEVSEKSRFQVWKIVEDQVTHDISFEITPVAYGDTDTFRALITKDAIIFQRRDPATREYAGGATIPLTDTSKIPNPKIVAANIRSAFGLITGRMNEMDDIVRKQTESIDKSVKRILSVPEIAKTIDGRALSEFQIKINHEPGRIQFGTMDFSSSYPPSLVDSGVSWKFNISNPRSHRYTNVTLNKEKLDLYEVVYAIQVKSDTQDPHIIDTYRIEDRTRAGFPQFAMPSTAYMHAKMLRQTADVIEHMLS